MDPRIAPPDLQTATGMAPEMDTQGLVGALRSRGSMPAGLLEAMRPTPMTPETMAYSAAAGGLNPGHPNPVVSQMGAQDQQRMQQAAMIDRIQQRQQDAETKRLGGASTVLQALLFGPYAVQDEDTRGILSKQYAQVLGQTTPLQLPPGVIASWTKGGPSQANQKEIATMLAGADAATDPAMQQLLLSRAHDTYTKHGGNDQEWDAVRQTLTNPVYLESVKLPTKEKLAEQQAKSETAQITATMAKNPQFKDTKTESGVAGYANEYTLRLVKKPLYMLDPTNPDDAIVLDAARKNASVRAEEANLVARQQHLEDEQTKADMTLSREKQLAQFRGDIAGNKPVVFNPAQAKLMLTPINTADTAMTEFNRMRGAIDRLEEKGLLPTNAGYGQGLLAGAKQLWNHQDSDVTLLKTTILPAVIGLVDRGLNDEKGTRAMSMFNEQVKLASGAPTKETFQKIFDVYQFMFAKKASSALALHEAELQRPGSRIDPTTVEIERKMFDQLFPKGVPPDPSQPKTQPGPLAGPLPPHTKMDNGTLVSEDGKHAWNGSKWVPR